VSWCPGEVFSCLADLITILLDDVRVVPGFSSKAERNEQIVQIDQRGPCNPRGADFHPGAGNRVQHPCRDDRNHTGCRLDMDDVTNGPPLTVMAVDAAPIQRMPPVVNNNFLPDMGRMTPQWPWDERTLCSPGPTAVANIGLWSQR
jgi:hypothetical protein